MSKIEKILQELEGKLYDNKRDYIGITDIIHCPKIPKTEKPKVIIGKIVDEYVKKILSKHKIKTDYELKVDYNGFIFYIHPDGIDEKEGIIYEIKSSTFDIPSDIFDLNKQYLLQVFSYLFFTHSKEVVFIFITTDKIKTYTANIEDFLQRGYKDLLKQIIDKYNKRIKENIEEPYTELCDTCFMKNSCDFSIIKQQRLDFIKNKTGIEIKKYYIAPFKLPQKGFLTWGNLLWYFEKIE